MATSSSRKAGRTFYSAAIVLLLGAIGVGFVQKQRESAVAIAAATGGDVQQASENAEYLGILSATTVLLAILSWGMAMWRREKHRWTWGAVVVLLSVYVLLELVMV